MKRVEHWVTDLERIMNKKKLICVLGVILFAVFINVYVIKTANQKAGDMVQFCVELSASQEDDYQVFPGLQAWNPESVQTVRYGKKDEKACLQYTIPNTLPGLRFDLGTHKGIHRVRRIYISYKNKTWDFDLGQAVTLTDIPGKTNQIEHINLQGNELLIKTGGDDGYIVLSLPDDMRDEVSEMRRDSLRIRYGLVCVLLDIFFIILLIHFNRCYDFLKELYHNRRLIFSLSKNDFKTKFAGSFFGVFWAFVQPVITILIYWFVFSVGFRSGGIADCPFALWLTAGLVPWFFFSDAWNGATNSLMEYSYLVKKVVFKISVLPIVKVLSSVFVSLCFHLFMGILFILYGYTPDVYWIQFIYYMVCNFVLVLSLSYITCSVIPFFRDMGQIINIILQVGVWLTPIMWNIEMLPVKWRWLMKINPMYYIVQGYRDALSTKQWFWQDITWTIYFWGMVGALFVLGNILFKRLRSHFADVL